MCRVFPRSSLFLVASIGVLSLVDSVSAVSPEVVAKGRALFEKNWTSRAPHLGSDGLGPMFNGRSCVGCHHQGGVGGGGDARFNAKTIGIERMRVSGGFITSDVLARAISGFHPGFVGPTGTVINTFPLAHHGGSVVMDESRSALMKKVGAKFSEHGGPVSAEEVRYANSTPILYSAKSGPHNVMIRARMYQRNTTPLFGAGMIDQVTGKQLESLERQQKKHPEISGRTATLKSGRYGKFGWRGNVTSLVEFCDQACAAEVGLETRRKRQPLDPTTKTYRNPSIDITDEQIEMMAAFIGALPPPQRIMPEDTKTRMAVQKGEQLFSSVGCAVCHVPSVGPAQGLYSDLLLHDMGPTSIDLNPADPYITRITPIREVTSQITSQTRTTETNSTGYYGGNTSMTVDETPRNRTGDRRTGGGRPLVMRDYDFVPPQAPQTKTRIVNLGSQTRRFSESEQSSEDFKEVFARGRSREGTTRTTLERTVSVTQRDYARIHIEPTNFNQEWRTPPLWGVRDSAPYMHDGRAETLLEAIAMHDGEAAGTRDRFLNLSLNDRNAIVTFLKTMVAPSNVPQPGI